MAKIVNNINWREDVQVVVAPPFPYLQLARTEFMGQVGIAGQDCSSKLSGAYTGDVSAQMLRDVGVDWVILGHSERRKLHGDTDQTIAAKIQAALGAGLRMIICVGETLDVRERGCAIKFVLGQLGSLVTEFSAVQAKEFVEKIVVAYEPIWAIGTGKSIAPVQAQEIHSGIRNWFQDQFGTDTVAGLRIIYGGSVNKTNCSQLALEPDIDGFLVGGASTSIEFVEIVQAMISKSRL